MQPSCEVSWLEDGTAAFLAGKLAKPVLLAAAVESVTAGLLASSSFRNRLLSMFGRKVVTECCGGGGGGFAV